MSTTNLNLAEAVDALGRGLVVVYPTETVYGLAVDATSPLAVERLLQLKGRGAGSGISVLVGSLDDAGVLVDGEPSEAARRLVEAFWPGPLTLVLAAADGVAPPLLGPTGGVGLRCSCDPVAEQLLKRFGRPLTSTSANPTGLVPASSMAEAQSYFAGRVAVYVDGGPRAGTTASTVVEFLEGVAYLRRPGAVSAQQLREYGALIEPVTPQEA